MATMPKCSGPAAWTRGVSWPLGLCRTKPLRARLGRAVRRRGMGLSFRVEKRCVLNPKGRGREPQRREFFSQLTPIPREFRHPQTVDKRIKRYGGRPQTAVSVRAGKLEESA